MSAHLPTPQLHFPPSDQSATFQHSPTPHSHLDREWEPGCQPDEVYAKVLPKWRDNMRLWLVRRLRAERDWMAAWQKRVRTPRRDAFFYWTAIFGTHTFFNAFLPLFFFFGDPERGRGLLHVVGLGIYMSSFAKDLVCSPRPYSPPIVRISMSTHHHEYGFPSSHSTNSVSIALFLGEWLLSAKSRIGFTPVLVGWALLFIYAVSVVGGRVYTGMHSTADIIGGSLMGIGCWLFWLIVGNASEAWVNTGTHLVPIISIPLTLALVHYHPEPVDDCPCFEDAIAVLAVILGSFVGHWYSVQNDLRSGVVYQRNVFEGGLVNGLLITASRVVFGVGLVFIFRLIAKATLLFVLPPIFRFAAKLFDTDLPTRRFYKAATDYQDVNYHLRPIPSVLDLHPDDHSATPAFSPEASGQSSPIRDLSPSSSLRLSAASNSLSRRKNKADQSEGEKTKPGENVWIPKRKRKSPAEKEKYDVLVLTKVGVYSGIGLMATTLIPAFFGPLERFLGLSV